jgi:hypothetical protein
MDIFKNGVSGKTKNIQGPKDKIKKWLGKSLTVKNYSFPVKNVLLISFGFIFIIAFVLYFTSSSQNNQTTDPSAAIEKETKALTETIGKFMELPAGEQPTLATVTDRAKLKGQEFFTDAQNGDKLLVYPKAGKAILYRPSIGKIIEATNLTSGKQENPQPPPEINP